MSNGYLSKPNNAQDLAKKLRLCSPCPPLEREQMGRESHRIVGFHSAENTWRTFEELYEGCLYQRYLDPRR